MPFGLVVDPYNLIPRKNYKVVNALDPNDVFTGTLFGIRHGTAMFKNVTSMDGTPMADKNVNVGSYYFYGESQTGSKRRRRKTRRGRRSTRRRRS